MKRFKIKWISGLALAALAAFVVMPGTSYAATSPTLTLNGAIIQGQGNFGVSGTCSTPGTVTYSITNPSGTTSLGGTNTTATTANGSGTFSFSANGFSVPSTYSTGAVTVTATCPNGDTVTTTASVLAPNSTLVGVNNPDSTLNNNVNITGACGTGQGASGTVGFSLTNEAGTTTVLAAGSNSTNASGTFNTFVTIPASMNSGLGTLTAVCSNGTTLSNLVVLGNPDTTVIVTPITDPGTGVGVDVGGTDEAGVAITPVGGVAAGYVSTSQIAWGILAISVVALIASLIARRRLS